MMIKTKHHAFSEGEVFFDNNYRGTATQKVKNFVLKHAQHANQGTSLRLPPMRKVAEHLGVSVATIQAAYRKLNSEGVIRTDRNRASYVTPLKGKGAHRVFHIGIDFIKGDEDLNNSWTGNLHGGMLHHALKEGNRIVFYRIPPRQLTKDHLTPDHLSAGLDGVVLAMLENIQAWASLGADIPAVFHTPVDMNATANFVSADIFTATKRIGRAFREGGRKRPFIASHCDFDSPDICWAQAGLSVGYGSGHTNWHSIGTIRFNPEESKDILLLEELYRSPEKAPDAIYCYSDYTAMRLLRNFQKMHIAVPDQVSVVGGTGLILMNTEYFAMTRIFQPLSEIGAELASQILRLITEDAPHGQFPGIFLPCRFGGGATTTKIENNVLGIQG